MHDGPSIGWIVLGMTIWLAAIGGGRGAEFTTG